MRFFLQWKLLKYLRRLNKRKKRREGLCCEAESDAAVDAEVRLDWVEEGKDECMERARQKTFTEMCIKSSGQESRLDEGDTTVVNMYTQPPLVKNLLDLVSLSSSCMRTEASKHGVCINSVKQEIIVMEELWYHFVHFHLSEMEVVDTDWVEQNKSPVFQEPDFLQAEKGKKKASLLSQDRKLVSQDLSTSSLSEKTHQTSRPEKDMKTVPTDASLRSAQDLFPVFSSVEKRAEQTPAVPAATPSYTPPSLDMQEVEVRKRKSIFFYYAYFYFSFMAMESSSLWSRFSSAKKSSMSTLFRSPV
jgi:hypothetical protein